MNTSINKKSSLIVDLVVSIIIYLSGMTNIYASGCDSCVASAANQANSQITSAMNQLIQTVNTSVQSLQQLNSTIQTADQSIVSTLKVTNEKFRESLAAATSAIALEITRNTKAMANLADHQVNTLVQTEQSIAKAKEKIYNEMTYSPELAQTTTGFALADRAIALKQGRVQKEQLESKYMEALREYNDDPKSVREGFAMQQKIKDASLDDEAYDPTVLLNKTVIENQEDADNMKRLLLFLTNPNPLPVLTKANQGGNNSAYELNRRIWNTRMELVQSVLSKDLHNKVGLIPTEEWRTGYFKETLIDDKDKTSLYEAMRGEIDGRIFSPGWYMEMKTKSPAGVKRETVYQKATQLKLLWELYQKEENNVLLMALLASLEMEKEKNMVKRTHPNR